MTTGRFNVLIFLSLLAFLSGCVTNKLIASSSIQPDIQQQKDITRLLGVPYSTKTDEDGEIWLYYHKYFSPGRAMSNGGQIGLYFGWFLGRPLKYATLGVGPILLAYCVMPLGMASGMLLSPFIPISTHLIRISFDQDGVVVDRSINEINELSPITYAIGRTLVGESMAGIQD